MSLCNFEQEKLSQPLFFSKDSSQVSSSSVILPPNEHIGKVIYLTTGFTILLTAFTSASNLVSEIYEQFQYDNLGKITLLTLYSVFFFAVFIVPGIIKSWSYKNGIFIGSLGYIFTMLAGALTTACASNSEQQWCTENYIYAINIGCAAINGLSAPVLWLSASRYVTGCTNVNNKGKLMGIFTSSVAAASVLGSVMAAFMTKMFGTFHYYLVSCGFVGFAILMFLFAPEVSKYIEGRESREQSVMKKTKKTVKLAVSIGMRPFLMYIFFVGLMQATNSAFEYRIIVSKIPDATADQKTFTTSLVFIVQGVLGIIASYSTGKLADKLKRKFVLNLFGMMAVLAMFVSYISNEKDDLGLTYYMGMGWGIAYNSMYTLTNIVMAKDFDGKLEAYAVNQLMMNLGTICGLILCIYVGEFIKEFLFVMFGFWVLSEIGLLFFKQKDDKLERIAGAEI